MSSSTTVSSCPLDSTVSSSPHPSFSPSASSPVPSADAPSPHVVLDHTYKPSANTLFPDFADDIFGPSSQSVSPISAVGQSGNESVQSPFIPHSISTSSNIFQLFKPTPQERSISYMPPASNSVARAKPHIITFADKPPIVKSESASDVSFDPFERSGATDADVAASEHEFYGVVDFRPILMEYVRPRGEEEVQVQTEVPQLPPFARFETTAAAQKLGEFVRTEFGITATFVITAGRDHALKGEQTGVHEEAAVLTKV